MGFWVGSIYKITKNQSKTHRKLSKAVWAATRTVAPLSEFILTMFSEKIDEDNVKIDEKFSGKMHKIRL